MRRAHLFALVLIVGSFLPSARALAESPPVYLFSWNTGVTPAGIVVRPPGTYVVNQGAAKIQQFTNLGALISEWGTYGSGDGEFRFPYGIAADPDGNLYVTDRDNYRVQTDRDPSISFDGTYIQFASDRPGGLGGMDLWLLNRAAGTVQEVSGQNSTTADVDPVIVWK